MATRRQIAANRQNGRKGGPKTVAGKAVSRLNARKHGVFASALTKYDKAELAKVYDELSEYIQPVGDVERMLTEMVALTYLRLQRCARAEGEFHVKTWEEERWTREEDRMLWRRLNGLRASWFRREVFADSVAIFGRYNTSLTNQLVKQIRELDRVQGMRLGKETAPPLAVDVTVTGDGELPDAG